MPPHDEPKEVRRVCQWVDLHGALAHFATYNGPTQSSQHIKPLHWYVACRLVLEGGFDPDEVTPHPPFSVRQRGGERILIYEPARATASERTVLGGLKTKNVDVVVTKPTLGPVVAVSCKGTTGAFRNLTNRMEEAAGDCTNLHITYPAMVYGFLAVLRANREVKAASEALAPDHASPARQLDARDVAIQGGGEPVETIIRYHTALRELTGRRGVRNDLTRYEAISLVLVESNIGTPGEVLASFPPPDSPLRIEQFFQTLYLRYDERYVYAAPDLGHVTRRHEWAPRSPALEAWPRPPLDFEPRLTPAG